MPTRRGAGRPAGQPSKTTEEIVAAAATVFRRNGYQGATMADIAAELDITKGSLYHYVDTKESLLFEAILRPYRNAVTHLREELSSQRPAPARLRDVIRLHVRNVVDHYPAISVYLEWARSLPVPEEVRRLDREYVAGIRRIMEEGAEAGTLRIGDPAVATEALLGMCNWFAITYRPDNAPPAGAVADVFCDIFLNGISAGGADG